VGGRQRIQKTVVAESAFTTLYIRHGFSVRDLKAIESLWLRVWARGGPRTNPSGGGDSARP